MMLAWSFSARTLDEVERLLRALGKHRYVRDVDLRLHWAVDRALSDLAPFKAHAQAFEARREREPSLEIARGIHRSGARPPSTRSPRAARLLDALRGRRALQKSPAQSARRDGFAPANARAFRLLRRRTSAPRARAARLGALARRRAGRRPPPRRARGYGAGRRRGERLRARLPRRPDPRRPRACEGAQAASSSRSFSCGPTAPTATRTTSSAAREGRQAGRAAGRIQRHLREEGRCPFTHKGFRP